MDRTCCRRRLPEKRGDCATDVNLSRRNEACSVATGPPAAKRPRESPDPARCSDSAPVAATGGALSSSAGVSAQGGEAAAKELNTSDARIHEDAALVDGFRRQELVRLLLRALTDLGLDSACTALEEESRVQMVGEEVKSLRSAVLNGDWTCALRVSELLDASKAVRKAVCFMILEQRVFEGVAMECCNNGSSASQRAVDGNEAVSLSHLLEELSEAVFDQSSRKRLLVSKQLCSCRCMEDLEQVAGHRVKHSRKALWDRIEAQLPPHLVVPPHRLSVLLWQATRYQQLHCLYRDAEDIGLTGIPLLEDYSYQLPELPSRCVAQLDKHADEVWFAAVSHSGQYIASSSKDQTVALWQRDPESSESSVSFSFLHALAGHSEPCSCVAWSADDQFVLTASNDRTVRLWTPTTEHAVHVFRKHTEAVTSVGWVHGCRQFFSAGFDKQIYLWDVDGTELHRWEIPSRIQDVGVTHDGKRMIVVNSDRNIKVIDILSRRELFALPESDAVTSICVSSLREEVLVNIAQQVSTSQQAPVIRLWDLQARHVAQRYLGHFQGRFVVRSCFGGPREEFVVSGSEDAQIYIWHRHYGSLLEVLPGHTATVNAVCWPCSPNRRTHGGRHDDSDSVKHHLISVSDDHTVRVWGPKLAFEAPTAASTQSQAGEATEATEEAHGEQPREGAGEAAEAEGEAASDNATGLGTLESVTDPALTALAHASGDEESASGSAAEAPEAPVATSELEVNAAEEEEEEEKEEEDEEYEEEQEEAESVEEEQEVH